jgi:hypothetical protein
MFTSTSNIKRCFLYWWKLAKDSKDRFEMMSWALTPILWLAASAVSFFYPHPNKLVDIGIWSLALLFTLRTVVWCPFRKDEEREKEIQKLKSENAKLELEFISPKDKNDRDPRINYCYPLRIVVRQTHPIKKVKEVRILIKKFSCPAWHDPIKTFPFKKMTFPIYLPDSGSQSIAGHEISPKPFEMVFDVFAVSMNLADTKIWIAPFNVNDRGRMSGESDISFDSNDFKDGVGEFEVEIQATADDVSTVSKKVVLKTESYVMKIRADKQIEQNEPSPPRWIV